MLANHFEEIAFIWYLFQRNFNNLLFKTDISRRKGCPNLMSVAEFHDTKFGSFRSAVASASDEDVDDEDAA